MWLTLTLFVIGFVFLIKGADLLVTGSSSIAKRLRITDIAIGLTVVAFGTSAPEFVVNVMASLSGSNDIAIGNIVGSNISNILLVLGLAAIIRPLRVKEHTTWKEMPFSLLTVILLAVIANDIIIDSGSFSVITRIDGIVLLIFFLIYLYYTFGVSKIKGVEHEHIERYSLALSLTMILLGLLGLTLGGRWMVDGAVLIASSLGLSQAFIGLTIIAVGTSLPELATTLIAARRGSVDIAVGAIIGSNIFNILFVLGVSSTLSPLSFSAALNIDILIVVLVTLLLFSFMFIGQKHVLDRWQGVGFVSIYAVYILYLIVRG